MTADIIIRPLTEADLPAAAELEACCFSDPWTRKGLRDTFREECACFLAAECGGVLCGYLNAVWVLDELNLNRICVHPDYRRRKIAEKLLETLKVFCRGRGITRIFLEVRESNLPAQALYRASGFAGLGKRPRFYQNPAEDAVLMGLKL